MYFLFILVLNANELLFFGAYIGECGAFAVPVRRKGVPIIIQALTIQLLVLAVLAGVFYWLPFWIAPPYPLWPAVLAQGALAAVFSARLGFAVWWWWIQLTIPVALYVALQWQLDALWGLLGFVLLWLFFANSGRERVPLFLTNATTRKALKSLIKRRQKVRFVDLGCGLGNNVVFMAQQVNVTRSVGVETAPLPFLLAKLYTGLRGGEVYAQSLWNTDLGDYDLVYAFLSSEPMPRLWQKVVEEMRPGTVFVSNSFAVPEVVPSEVWQLDDKRATRLYIYCRD